MDVANNFVGKKSKQGAAFWQILSEKGPHLIRVPFLTKSTQTVAQLT